MARCRSKSAISAAAQGHLCVWPSSRVVVTGDAAVFFKDGKKVWQTNAVYATSNFDLEPLQTGWFTDQYNRAGTAHFQVVDGDTATSLCGRSVAAQNLQPDADAIRKCARCVKAKERAG